jgi:hypothetical protein
MPLLNTLLAPDMFTIANFSQTRTHLPGSFPSPTKSTKAIKRLGDASLQARLKPWMRRWLERFFRYRR